VINISLSYLLCTVSKLWQIIGQLFAIDRRVLHFNTLAGGDPCEYPDKLYLDTEARVIVLPDAENRTIVFSL